MNDNKIATAIRELTGQVKGLASRSSSTFAATGFIATTPTGIRCSGAVVVDSDGQTRIRFN